MALLAPCTRGPNRTHAVMDLKTQKETVSVLRRPPRRDRVLRAVESVGAVAWALFRLSKSSGPSLGSAPTLEAKKLRPQARVPAATHATWTSVILSRRLRGRVRVEMRLPALSCGRGERPAHETKCPGVGNRVISMPIPATMTRATVWPAVGMSQSVDGALKGREASPKHASTSRTATSRASIWVRCNRSKSR
jgi:hypothetical protein